MEIVYHTSSEVASVMFKITMLISMALYTVMVLVITKNLRLFVGTILLGIICMISSKVISDRCDKAYPNNPFRASIIWGLCGVGLAIAMVAALVFGHK